ncbi:Beta/gamma crystallin domain-containing protein 1 [Varanus komodoensis]|nr:Beta/gamma crystallin domain-containing protein 1 [Varanus komodoensis]
MPDTQYTSHPTQLPLVPSQESLFAYAIPMVQITTSTLPASFRKSKTRNPASSKEENKKKPVLGKFGNFFITGRRRNPKNSLETSQRPTVRNVRSESPPKNLAPLASIDIEDIKDLSKSEESLTDQAYDQNQSSLWSTIEDTEEYLYNKDLTPLYNDIVSEWNTKGISSDSEWSTDWHSSNETIKNTVFDSSLTLQTLEAECDCVTDTTNSTTPDFFKSVTNISSEDLEHSTLNHKQLVDVQNSEQLEYAASQDAPVLLESKQSKHVHPSRVLTLDIFLRKTEQPNLYEPETVVIDNDCNRIDIMDKKPVTKRSGKRRKSQSSSDMSNGDKNVTENIVKEEPSLDAPSSDLVSEKVNSSERKGKASQQIHSPTANHDIRAGNIHKGLTKTELEKSKQQAPTSSPYRRKSLKKNQSDAGPLSPTGLKSYGKDSNTRRPNDGATDGNPASKCPSAEKLPSGESTVDATKASSISIIGSSTLPVSEGSTESKESHLVKSSDGNVQRPTDSHENGEMGTTNGKQVSSDLDSAKQRNKGFDSSRMVTTKVNL